MKWFLFFLISFPIPKLYGQEYKVKSQLRDSTATKGYIFEVETKAKMSAYADSLNNYNGGPLPSFILRPCLDWDKGYWPDLHTAVSIRWLILQKVNNKNALKMVLRTNDSRLKQICTQKADKFLSIPMIEDTFYQLIKKRYKEL